MSTSIIIVIAFIALILATSMYFSCLVVFPRRLSIEKTIQGEQERGLLDLAAFNNLPQQEILVASPYGYDLYGVYIPFQDSNKTVVIAHGIGVNLYCSVKYMQMFRQRGFNVLLYEHRNHGRSGGKNTTFGLYEKVDLKAIMDWAMNQLKPGGIVGTHGESLGAAIALQHAAIDPRVSFVVADCPYSDFMELVKFRSKRDYHLPPFPILNLASLFSRLLTGMSFSMISPIRDLAGVTCPILFIHGQLDTYIPPQMSMDMAAVKRPGISRLYLAPEAGHAQSLWKNPEEYDRVLGEFLAEVL